MVDFKKRLLRMLAVAAVKTQPLSPLDVVTSRLRHPEQQQHAPLILSLTLANLNKTTPEEAKET
jgi:hypothetical protein